MRNLVYYVACSVDTFIAHPDGSFSGFLFTGPQMDDLVRDFPETVPSHMRAGLKDETRYFDTVLMGRKTYEIGLAEGVTSPYHTLRQLVVSRSITESPDPAVELVREEPLELVRTLKQEAGKDIWLCGGGELATALFPEIDALILKVHPFVMGEGIPLFSSKVTQTPLTLTESKVYPNGFMRLHYNVNPAA